MLGLLGRHGGDQIAGTCQLLQAGRGQAGSCRLTRNRHIVAGPAGDQAFAGQCRWQMAWKQADEEKPAAAGCLGRDQQGRVKTVKRFVFAGDRQEAVGATADSNAQQCHCR